MIYLSEIIPVHRNHINDVKYSLFDPDIINGMFIDEMLFPYALKGNNQYSFKYYLPENPRNERFMYVKKFW